jgi:hypothetical protein
MKKPKALHNVCDSYTVNVIPFEQEYASTLATNTQCTSSINEHHELVAVQPSPSRESRKSSQPVTEFSSEFSHFHDPSVRSRLETNNPTSNQLNYDATTASTLFRPSEVPGSLVTTAISNLNNISHSNPIDRVSNQAMLAYSVASRLLINSNDIIGLVFDERLNIESIFQVPLMSILVASLQSDGLNNLTGVSNSISSESVLSPSRGVFNEQIGNLATTNYTLGQANLSGNPL